MDKLLENNNVLKVLSVIVAIFIWFQASAATAQTVNRPIGPVAVGFSTPNPHLTVLSIKPASVIVQIKGPPGTVGSASEVSALVKLANLTSSGTYSLKVSATVPPGTGLVSVVPNRVVVTVARLGQRKVPVMVHISGSPASGYELSGYISNLKKATISGPVNVLSQVKSVTGTVVLGDRSGSFTDQIVLQPLNAEGHAVPKVQVNPATATVNVSIQKRPPQKVLPVISKLSGQPAAGFTVSQITVYPSSVTVSGTTSSLSGLTHLYTIPINVAGQTRSIHEAVPVVMPNGVNMVNSGEVTVTVTIVKSG